LRYDLGLLGAGFVVLGACVLANPGSAETLEPSAVFDTRPASVSAALALPSDGWARSDVRRYYKERPAYRPGPPPIQGWFTMRGGFYDMEDASENDWTVGIKGTGVLGEVMQAGISFDLQRRTGPSGVVTSRYVDGSGNIVTVATQGLDSESNLWPLMGVLEFHFPGRGLDPYFGAAGGWEFLYTQVRDYTNGIQYDANYDGPGYQFYGGLGVPINPRAKFTAEAFWNGATVKRDFYDPYLGVGVEEKIKVDGFGGRAGFAFAY